MFKYWKIKKYGDHLAKKLAKRYGENTYYTASQVRATVYQCNYQPTYLPLGYLLYLEESQRAEVLNKEFPELDVVSYKNEMLNYLSKKQYHGSIHQLKHS